MLNEPTAPPPITLTVSFEEAQTILDALTEMPYRRVADLIQKILLQASASNADPEPPAAAEAPDEGAEAPPATED
ncbi:MAG: hypothetical protein ACE37J_12235 [Pikeienuella sp.]|uniref:hypothetical protein n=1 Tax=Pikeienuella sp. TaxID=2831957 RepID=UPI00391A21E0